MQIEMRESAKITENYNHITHTAKNKIVSPPAGG